MRTHSTSTAQPGWRRHTTLVVAGAMLCALLPAVTPARGDTGDPTVTVSTSTPTVTEGSQPGTAVSFSVKLDLPAAQALTIHYRTFGLTARADEGDYAGTTAGTVTVPVLSTSATVTIPVEADAIAEDDEQFGLQLLPGDGYVLGSTIEAVVTIQDDDPHVAIGDGPVVAEGETATIGVTLSAPLVEALTVEYSVADGSAVAGDDYTAPATMPGTVTIGPGETTADIDVATLMDADPDGCETFTVDLHFPDAESRVTLGRSSATIVITDATDIPCVTASHASVVEGNSGSRALAFSLEVTPAPAEDLVVSYATAPATASTGTDFLSKSSSATLTTVDPDATVSVTAIGDTRDEVAETLTLAFALDDPTQAVFPDGSLTVVGTIVDDDTTADTRPIVTVAAVELAEGTGDPGDTTGFAFPVTLSAAAPTDVQLRYRTNRTTGTAGDGLSNFGNTPATNGEDTDYERTPQDSASWSTVTIPAGVTRSVLPVPVFADDKRESDETFTVNVQIDRAQNLALAGGTCSGATCEASALGTILDDDPVPTITVADVEGREGDGFDVEYAFVVSLSNPTALHDVTVGYATAAGSAVAGQDYREEQGSLTIEAGERSVSEVVLVVSDEIEEPVETFGFLISTEVDPSQAVMGDDQATGTIIDDDGPELTVDDSSVVEGDEGSSDLTFTVSLNEAREDGKDVTVDYVAADDSATGGGVDFQDTAGTATIPAGELSTTVVVPIVADTEVEGDETLILGLSGAQNAQLIDATATGTIVDDDEPATPDEPNTPPVAVIDGPATSDEGLPVDFDASGSSDVDGEIVEYRWVFGDGTAAATGPSVTHRFPDDGTYTVALRVTDDDGAIHLVTQDVSVTNLPPTPQPGPAPSGEPTEELVFTSGATDPGNDALTYRWDLGDGGEAKDGKTVRHRYAEAGTYTATVTVTDDDGGVGTAEVELTVADSGVVVRIAGDDRIATSVAAASHWESADDVLLAYAYGFPDALAGGALGNILDAPLLLTEGDRLSDAVSAELARLSAKRVWILGGEQVVSPAVRDRLEADGYEVHRFAGADRYGTAALIGFGVGASPQGEVQVTLGAHEVPDRAWPDALSAGALAATPDVVPTLLSRADEVPDITEDVIAALGATRVLLVGGTAALSTAVAQRFGELGYEVERLAGDDRYATSVAVAQRALDRLPDAESTPVVFATGANYPDGLAAAATAAKLGAVLVLVPPSDLDEAGVVRTFLETNAHRFDEAVVLGGRDAVPDRVVEQLEQAMRA